MKKATMNTILSLIATIDTPEAEAVRAELNAELGKDKARKDANQAVYDAVKPIVMDELGETPVTISELYDAIAEKLPADFTKSKLQYAMTRLWTAEIGKVEGKVNSYYKA